MMGEAQTGSTEMKVSQGELETGLGQIKEKCRSALQTIKLQQGLLPSYTSTLFTPVLLLPSPHLIQGTCSLSSFCFFLHLIYNSQPTAPEASPQLYVINAN